MSEAIDKAARAYYRACVACLDGDPSEADVFLGPLLNAIEWRRNFRLPEDMLEHTGDAFVRYVRHWCAGYDAAGGSRG